MSQDLENEELVLKEALVSATGLDASVLQIGIKGDPSLRETAYTRIRYSSELDKCYQQLECILSELLIHHSSFQIFIGFNNAEVRIRSIFDPLREEIHEAEKLLDPAYIKRHFPRIPFDEKISAMRELYNFVLTNRSFTKHLPPHWKNIFNKRHDNWQAMNPDEVVTVFQALGKLRSMEDFYLRNVMISVVQSVVRMQFNCDGTQIVQARDFKEFIDQTL